MSGSCEYDNAHSVFTKSWDFLDFTSDYQLSKYSTPLIMGLPTHEWLHTRKQSEHIDNFYIRTFFFRKPDPEWRVFDAVSGIFNAGFSVAGKVGYITRFGINERHYSVMPLLCITGRLPVDVITFH